MHTRAYLGFLAVVACASAASISGTAGINGSSIYAQGSLTWPNLPGLNNNRNNSQNITRNNLFDSAANTLQGLGNIGNLFGNLAGDFVGSLISMIPDFESTLAGIPNLANARNITVPSLRNSTYLANTPYIPGLTEALENARNHVRHALNVTSDIQTGIQTAIQSAFLSGDPVGASRAIIETILRVYGVVAAHCPLIIVGERVIQEGIRLAIETLRSIRNVAIGTPTVTVF